MKIFISHSSLDKSIVDLFVQHILMLGIGLNADDIFCTSLQGHKIDSGENFPKEIKRQLIEADIVIIMISENYKNSEVCLNEMGATWILEKDRATFIIDSVKYKEVGFLLINDQIERIDSDDDLDNFRDSVQSRLSNTANKISIWNSNKKKFLSAIQPNTSTSQKTTRIKYPVSEELSERELKFLHAINESATQQLSSIDLQRKLSLRKSYIDLMLKDLVRKKLLTSGGVYYKLTEKANRIIFKL